MRSLAIFGVVFGAVGASGVLLTEGFRGFLHLWPDLGVKLRYVLRASGDIDEEWRVPLRWTKRRSPEPIKVLMFHLMYVTGVAALFVWCIWAAGSAVARWL